MRIPSIPPLSGGVQGGRTGLWELWRLHDQVVGDKTRQADIPPGQPQETHAVPPRRAIARPTAGAAVFLLQREARRLRTKRDPGASTSNLFSVGLGVYKPVRNLARMERTSADHRERAAPTTGGTARSGNANGGLPALTLMTSLPGGSQQARRQRLVFLGQLKRTQRNQAGALSLVGYIVPV